MRILIRLISGLVDLCVVFVFMLLFMYGAYTVYDTRRIYVDASSVKFETYKPRVEDEKSFSDFAGANPDVRGWITVYGTNIDYPLVWSEEFDKYINTDPEGNFSLSGSIFLDHRNSGDLSDFKNIIYGHHMEKHQMFGDVDQFRKEAYFEEHEYGDLYYQGAHYGIHFFSYFEGDAYDDGIYNLPLSGEEEREEFLRYARTHARHYRDVPVQAGDKVVLLSTCAGSTNGRYLLVGKLTAETYADTFVEEKVTREAYLAGKVQTWLEELPWWWPHLLVFLLLLFIILMIRKIMKIRKSMKNRKHWRSRNHP